MTRVAAMVVVLLALSGFAAVADNPGGMDDPAGPASLESLAEWERGFDRAYRDQLHALAQRGDSRSLFAASRLIAGTTLGYALPDPERLAANNALSARWLADAIKREPVEPLALWYAAGRCHAESACDRTALLARLSRLDPDNAMIWIELAADAVARGEQADADHYFAQATASPRYDAYERAYGQLLIESHDGFDLPALPAALSEAMHRQREMGGMSDAAPRFDVVGTLMMAHWAAHAFPGFQHLTTFCPVKTPAAMTPERREACLALLSTLDETATSMLARHVALSALARLTRDDADGAPRLERLRQWQWRFQRYGELASAAFDGEIAAGHVRKLLGEGELVAMDFALAASCGLSEAPPDWIPQTGAASELWLDSPTN